MAASPQIKVQISAVDQYSAQLAKMRKDLATTSRAADAASKRIGSGFQLPALNTGAMRRGLDDLDRHVSTHLRLAMRGGIPGLGTVASVSGLIPGMGAVAGIGAVGGIGELMDRFARGGVSLENTARLAGTTAARMDSMRGAARLVGLDAGAADQAMIGLNKTIADAYYGKDPRAMSTFLQFGIGLQGIAGGAARAEEVLPKIADHIREIAKSDPRAAVTMLQNIGLSADVLPLLIRGSDGLADLRKQVELLYGDWPTYLRASERFTGAMGRMGIVTDRLGMSIMSALEPALTPMLLQLSNFVDRHQTDIAETFTHLGHAIEGIDWGKVGHGVESVGHFLSEAASEADDFGKRINHVLDTLGEVKRIVQLPGLKFDEWLDSMGYGSPKWAAQTATQPGSYDYATPRERVGSGTIMGTNAPLPSGAEQQTRAAHARDMLVGMGWSKDAAAGIVANIQQESGFDPTRIGDSGAAYGLAQWHADRRAAIARGMGVPVVGSSFDDQIRAIDWELRHTESGAGNALRNARSAPEAGSIVSRYYERPRDADAEAASRGGLAQRWDQQWSFAAPSNGPPTVAPRLPTAPVSPAQGAAGLINPANPQGAYHPSPSPGSVPSGYGSPSSSAPAEPPDLSRGGRLPQGASPAFGPPPAASSSEPTSGGSSSRLPALLAAPAAAPAAPAQPVDNGSSTVRVEITHDNAPANTRLTAATQGNGVELGTIRVRRAMPDAGAFDGAPGLSF